MLNIIIMQSSSMRPAAAAEEFRLLKKTHKMIQRSFENVFENVFFHHFGPFWRIGVRLKKTYSTNYVDVVILQKNPN
jgi:hypothetical protein